MDHAGDAQWNFNVSLLLTLPQYFDGADGLLAVDADGHFMILRNLQNADFECVLRGAVALNEARSEVPTHRMFGVCGTVEKRTGQWHVALLIWTDTLSYLCLEPGKAVINGPLTIHRIGEMRGGGRVEYQHVAWLGGGIAAVLYEQHSLFTSAVHLLTVQMTGDGSCETGPWCIECLPPSTHSVVCFGPEGSNSVLCVGAHTLHLITSTGVSKELTVPTPIDQALRISSHAVLLLSATGGAFIARIPPTAGSLTLAKIALEDDTVLTRARHTCLIPASVTAASVTGMLFLGSHSGPSQLLQLSVADSVCTLELLDPQMLDHAGPIVSMCIAQVGGARRVVCLSGGGDPVVPSPDFDMYGAVAAQTGMAVPVGLLTAEPGRGPGANIPPVVRDAQAAAAQLSQMGAVGNRVQVPAQLRVGFYGYKLAEHTQGPSMSGRPVLTALRAKQSDDFHSYLLFSFPAAGTTQLMAIGGEEFEPCQVEGIDEHHRTVYAASIPFGIVQVTDEAARLVSSDGRLVTSWKAPSKVSAAASSSTDLLVIACGQKLIALRTQAAAIQIACTRELVNEVSAVCVWNDIVIAATWVDPQLFVLAAQSLDVLCNVPVPKSHARSITVVEVASSRFVLVGMADGRLFEFALNATSREVTGQRVLEVANSPLDLRSWTQGDTSYVIATSSSHVVLEYSTAGVQVFGLMAPPYANPVAIHTSALRNSYAWLARGDTEEVLVFGELDWQRAMQWRSADVLGAPVAVAAVPASETIVALCEVSTETCILHGVGGGSLERLYSSEFRGQATSLCVTQPKDAETPVALLGMLHGDESGSIVALDPGSGQILHRMSVAAVTALASLPGGFVLVAAAPKLIVLHATANQLKTVCEHKISNGTVPIFSIATRELQFACSAFLQNITLYAFDAKAMRVQRLASINWPIAVSALCLLSDLLLVTDERRGICVLSIDGDKLTQRECSCCDELLNGLSAGSIVQQFTTSSLSAAPATEVTWASAGGALGRILPVPPIPQLVKLKEQLAAVQLPTGGRTHREFWTYVIAPWDLVLTVRS
eukprot:TRINITY_DN7319_c0_g1_i2.p1 TRINITY_DN7319_c0_g1~~TRINITY_DN7319_c0_g1_i2.p1  ORF type:complete len:1107 (+),score=202.51 TRINITY_DN7319_c0_g1_i2:174-3323(+)